MSTLHSLSIRGHSGLWAFLLLISSSWFVFDYVSSPIIHSFFISVSCGSQSFSIITKAETEFTSACRALYSGPTRSLPHTVFWQLLGKSLDVSCIWKKKIYIIQILDSMITKYCYWSKKSCTVMWFANRKCGRFIKSEDRAIVMDCIRFHRRT